MPGVLIVEGHGSGGWGACFQIDAWEERGKPVYFLGIDHVRFRKPVTPGDQLRLELEIHEASSSIWGFKGKSSGRRETGRRSRNSWP